MNLKFIEPESKLIINKVFKRNFDGFTDEAKRSVNWAVLVGDIFAAYILLNLL